MSRLRECAAKPQVDGTLLKAGAGFQPALADANTIKQLVTASAFYSLCLLGFVDRLTLLFLTLLACWHHPFLEATGTRAVQAAEATNRQPVRVPIVCIVCKRLDREQLQMPAQTDILSTTNALASRVCPRFSLFDCSLYS